MRFDGDSEKAFRHFYYKKCVGQVRFALFMAIFLYGVVGFIDPYVVPDSIREVRVLRYLLACPVFAAFFLLSFVIRREIFIQLAAGISVLVGGFAVSMMMFVDPGLGSQIYYGGLILVIIYGYTFFRLRFGYATACGWAVAAFYIIACGYIKKTAFPVLINNALFSAIANTIGMFVAYTLEMNLRHEYLHMISMKKTEKGLQSLSFFDKLTRIPNRRMFDLRFSAEVRKAQRAAQPISLIVVDIDYFKAYNDNLGHLAGDNCLQKIAEILQHCARRSGDFAARYGGEEFAVILPNTPLGGGEIIAKRIQESVRALNLPHPASPAKIVSLSMGIACIVPNYRNSPEELFAAADGALYRAKNSGRDRIEISAPK